MTAADNATPVDSVCIIKEPFFDILVTGEYCLKVDHISDIIWLPIDYERRPSA